MAKPTAPGTVTAPSTGNPDTFASDADALVAWQVGPFYTYLVSLADWVDETAALVGVADGIISGTTPDVVLYETDATSTFAQTALVMSGGNFSIQTRTATGTFAATDFTMTRGASGATMHTWRINGADKVRLDANNLQLNKSIWYSAAAWSDTITVAHDGVGLFTAPFKGGLVAVTVDADTAFPLGSALYAYDVGDTVSLAPIYQSGLFAYTTGPLTGTTGADLKFTASVHTNGVFYMESRHSDDSAHVITCTFFGWKD